MRRRGCARDAGVKSHPKRNFMQLAAHADINRSAVGTIEVLLREEPGEIYASLP